ncbi:hypothetical protein IWX49DRAFT_314775 [Phyllosticta citricarpa]|uniref:Uncharacterized protein n=1 Tax=Phyllosticta citricarpa TaxID=55181 RepID=A0ABR1LE54_9PEZI
MFISAGASLLWCQDLRPLSSRPDIPRLAQLQTSPFVWRPSFNLIFQPCFILKHQKLPPCNISHESVSRPSRNLAPVLSIQHPDFPRLVHTKVTKNHRERGRSLQTTAFEIEAQAGCWEKPSASQDLSGRWELPDRLFREKEDAGRMAEVELWFCSHFFALSVSWLSCPRSPTRSVPVGNTLSSVMADNGDCEYSYKFPPGSDKSIPIFIELGYSKIFKMPRERQKETFHLEHTEAAATCAKTSRDKPHPKPTHGE